MSTVLPTLYSRSSTGAIQQWSIEVSGDKYRTTHGQMGGKMNTTEWSYAEPTNVGKKNERLGPAQALFEAKAIWKKRIEHGCFEDLKQVDQQLAYFDVMLAGELDKLIKKIDFSKGVLVQNKYNGVRCVARLEDGEVVLRSRGGKIWTSVPHIVESLKSFFREYPNAILDGELYNYELRQKLNELISIVRKKNPTPEELVLSEKMVRFYIYDGFGFKSEYTVDCPYVARKAFIDGILPMYSKYYRKVETWIAWSLAEVDKIYESFLADGEEGAIVRMIDSKYESGKRSNTLLKYKPEDDTEGVITKIEEGDGEWSGAATRVYLAWNGKNFKGTFKGTYEQRAEILKNQKDWIGQEVTFFYTGFTGKGVPNYARVDPNNCFKADR